ncbi:MAG: YciI family protein [Cellvibrionaceae bacterium]
MWYAIICEDIDNSLPLRKATRPAHLDYLQNLQEQGRLLTAGPFPAIDSNEPGENGFSGSLIIAEFDSLAVAEDWANNDPYQVKGVFKKVTIKPYKKVF